MTPEGSVVHMVPVRGGHYSGLGAAPHSRLSVAWHGGICLEACQGSSARNTRQALFLEGFCFWSCHLPSLGPVDFPENEV